jgi:diphthamide synthase (EF-2-diphthine--ammonia ligase)
VVGAQSRVIDAEWLGRQVDKDFVEYLKSKDLCPCGENGEYHTLVINGPIFNKGIQIVEARTIARDNYWFLDTCKYRVG